MAEKVREATQQLLAAIQEMQEGSPSMTPTSTSSSLNSGRPPDLPDLSNTPVPPSAISTNSGHVQSRHLQPSTSGARHLQPSTSRHLQPLSASRRLQQSTSRHLPSTSGYEQTEQTSTSQNSSDYITEMGRLFPIYRKENGNKQNNRKRPSNQQFQSTTEKRAKYLVLPNTWTHKFMCLSDPTQVTVPSAEQKRKLQEAGLGEKKVTFDKIKTPTYFHTELLKSFPKLSNAGGYELLRSNPTSISQLEPIQTNPSYNVIDLKAAVTSAKIYIRPIQKELSMEIGKDITQQVSEIFEKCSICGRDIPMNLIKNHIGDCQQQQKTDPLIDTCPICLGILEDDPDLAQPETCSCKFHAICLGEWKSTVEDGNAIKCPSCNVPFTNTKLIYESANYLAPDNQENVPLAASTEVVTDTKCDTKCDTEEPTCLADALKQKLDSVKLKWVTKNNEFEEDTYMPIKVTRHKFWSQVIDQMELMTEEEWRPQMHVVFIDESGVDTGGPSREFISLLYSDALVSGILEGSPPNVTFAHNQTAMHRNIYKYFGSLTAISILNGSTGPNYFSPSVANYILDLDHILDAEELIAELPDTMDELKGKLDKVRLSENLQEMTDIVHNFPERFDFGFNKVHIEFDDKIKLIYSAVKHVLISSCVEEILSYRNGLMRYGVFDILKAFPNEAKALFINQQLSVKDMEEMFLPEFSVSGSSRRLKEDEIYFNWLQFLKEVNRKRLRRTHLIIEDDLELVERESTLSLSDVLQFITGSRNKPLAKLRANIIFDHDVDAAADRRLNANTCGPNLKIPVNRRYTDSLKKFINYFADDIFDSPGFGLV